MSKEATIIQSFNDVKRQYEYSVKGYDVTESVKILLKRHKEEYDKEKNIFAGIDGYLEAQKECQSQISDLETKLAEKEKEIENLYDRLNSKQKFYEMSLEKDYKEYLSRLYKLEKQCDKDKVSFTIEQLEKVKSVINTSVRDDHIIWDFDIKAHIDNQIKQLKGEVYE